MARQWAMALSPAVVACLGGCAASGVYISARPPPAVYGASRWDLDAVRLIAGSSAESGYDPLALLASAAFIPLLTADLAVSAVVDTVMLPQSLASARRVPPDRLPPTTQPTTAQPPQSAATPTAKAAGAAPARHGPLN